MNPIIIIPARMNASRFYGKPLQLINNLPMVVKIMQQALTANLCKVVVATPDREIANVIKEYNGEAIITSDSWTTGTDRIAEAINILDPNNQYNTVVNLQGDLAIFQTEILTSVLNALKDNPSFDIATAAVLINNPSLINNSNTVKVVMSFLNDTYAKALYFTRSTCPYGEGDLYQHLGIYAYRRKALNKFVTSKSTPLEKRENLEQLRALEIGLNIIVSSVTSTPLEVNTPQDLEYIRATLNKNNNFTL